MTEKIEGKEIVYAIEDGIRYIVFIQGENITQDELTAISESLEDWWKENERKFYILASGDKTVTVKFKRTHDI